MSPSTLNGLESQRFASQDTLFKIARHHAQTHPDEIGFTFLVDGETEELNLTYGELDARARVLAAKTQSICRPGDHVLLLYGPGLDYIVALFACQYAGVIPVPAYPPDPMRSQRTLSRLQAIASDCGATLALGAAENVAWLSSLTSQQCLTLSTDTKADWTGLPWTAPASDADQVALLQYTSGSTAAPRGVMVTHRNLWSQFETIQVGDGADAVGVSWLPFYHDLGLIGGILIPLAFDRRRAYLMSPLAFVQHPLRWLLAISRYRATTTGAPNFAFDLCVNKFVPAQAPGLDLSSLRIMLTGAEPIRSDSLDRFMATFAPYGLKPDVWRPGYGMAETTLGATGIRHGAQLRRGDFSIPALANNRAELVAGGSTTPARRMVGCGWALDGSEVIVVDPLTATELAAGHVGEVWVRGPIVARGYWNRPEETRAVFGAQLANNGRGPFLRTGDLGFQHEGQLYLTGRSKEVMVFWGRNVYPQDVEITTWSCHASLKQNAGAAFAVEVDAQERLVVVQEVARPEALDLDAIAQAVSQSIRVEQKVAPYALVFIKTGTLPKTSSGKVQRLTARAMFTNNQLDVIKQWQFAGVLDVLAATPAAGRDLPSREEIRDWLTARIARHCAVAADQIDTDASLSRYVMDSVSAIGIAMELQQWLGRALEPTVIFDSPSVAVLAERLANLQSYPKESSGPSVAVDQLNPSELDRALAQVLAASKAGEKDLT